MEALDRYLPAMLRLTGGSPAELVEACAAAPASHLQDGGETLRVALFRSLIAHGRERRGPARSRPAVNRTEAFAEPSTRMEGRRPAVRSLGGISCLLTQAIDDLRPAVREVVVLRDVAGLSTSEVKSILFLSRDKQSALLHEGRMELRGALGRSLEDNWTGGTPALDGGPAAIPLTPSLRRLP